MFFLKPFLLGVILPALISGIVLIFAWRRNASIIHGFWGGAIALGAGYVAGHAGAIGWPPFPPVEATQWLVYLTPAASLYGLIDALWRNEPAWVRWGGRALLSGLVSWMLLHPLLKSTWEPIEGGAWLVGLWCAMLAFWTVLDVLAKHLPTGLSMPLVLLLVAGGSSSVLFLSGSALLSQLSGVLASMLGASLVVALWRPRLSLAHGGISVVTVLLAGLWLNGYFYVEVPPTSALLLAISPAAAWVGQIKPVRQLALWKAALVYAGAVAVPIAIAVAFVVVTSSPSNYGY